MTKEQKREALLALERGCQIAHEYINCEGKTCAIGALAKRANVSRDELEKDNKECITVRGLIAETILIRYGISRKHQQTIQRINDENDNVEDRTEAVMRYVNNLPTED